MEATALAHVTKRGELCFVFKITYPIQLFTWHTQLLNPECWIDANYETDFRQGLNGGLGQEACLKLYPNFW